MISFCKWCTEKYYGKKSPRGELAMDMKHDDEFPFEAHDRKEILNYLHRKHACRWCIAIFESAYRSYKKEILVKKIP
jgi:uncharacterized protein YozE (UPF0346 family)